MTIAVVTQQIEGLNKNGGIGTANRHLAEHLRAAGHTVDIWHTGCVPVEAGWACVGEALKARGIRLFGVHSDGNAGRPFQARQMAVYEALRDTDYEIFLFHDWLAHGFFCFLARETGTAFRRARLGLTLHSPQAWCDQANRHFPASHEEVVLYDMERACAERADFVTAPSQYMLDWAREHGWRLPADTFVIPNFISSPETAPVPTSRAAADGSLELCFFGRLEDRKGLPVFVDALKDLSLEERRAVEVSFLGSPCPYTPEDTRRMLGSAVGDFRALSFQTELDTFGARSYLRGRGRVAVMPSLVDNSPCVVQECLEEGIPFLASDRGGGSELVAAEDKARVTFPPTRKGLAEALSRAIAAGGVEPARPRWTVAEARRLWESVLLVQREKAAAEAKCPAELGGDLPLVSAVLVHHDRPETLAQALGSLQRQTYRNLEIVLVDDGSRRPEAQAFLDRVERELVGPHPLRVVRQENRYLGAARNLGLRESRGEYVLFFDDDNVALPEMVERYIAVLQRTGADVVSGAMRYFHALEGPPTAEDLGNQLCHFMGGASGLSGLFDNHYGDATSLYRRSAVEKAGGFHEIYGVTHEDWKLFLDLHRTGARIVSIPEMQYWYRVTPGSMIRSTRRYDNFKALLSSYAGELSPRLAALPELVVGMFLERERRQAPPSAPPGAGIDEAVAKLGQSQFFQTFCSMAYRAVNKTMPKGSRRREWVKRLARTARPGLSNSPR